MTDVAIRIENLGKRYRYGGATPLSANLRADLTDWIRGMVRGQGCRSQTTDHRLQSGDGRVETADCRPQAENGTPTGLAAGPSLPSAVPEMLPHKTLREVHEERLAHDPNYFWALKDVNLEIKQGEVVGIIGRNGAGKSTLLKILSRITPPTTGKVTYHGRVASLLEVGTGFHRELTGRENVFLNGSILGMRRAEISKKLGDIIEFAELERFSDTPVKFYSSGMYVRLAFAVAAHLEPDILLVDEVLAVGDAEFQKRCLGKMRDVARAGRTVLFVSHNMVAVEALCPTAVELNQGRIGVAGNSATVISAHLSRHGTSTSGTQMLGAHPGRTPGSVCAMKTVTLYSVGSTPISAFRINAPLSIAVSFSVARPVAQPVLGVVVKTALGVAVFGVNNRVLRGFALDHGVSTGTITCVFDRVPLMPGRYLVDLYFGDPSRDVDVVTEATSFEVEPSDVFGTGRLPPPAAGPVCWPARWSFSGA